MPLYLDTRGNAQVAVALCDRCRKKFPIGELMADGDAPGLRVCRKDRDNFDPWRLPARRTENIALQYPRPEEPLVVEVGGDLLGVDFILGESVLGA
jgi:hypothetical protein